MTPEEFAQKEKELLGRVPPEFRSYFSYEAYEEGHSGGYEEVLSHLKGMVSDGFIKCLRQYTERKIAEAITNRVE